MRISRDELNARKLRYRCTTCGAKPGESCTLMVRSDGSSTPEADATYFAPRCGPDKREPHVCRGAEPKNVGKIEKPKRRIMGDAR